VRTCEDVIVALFVFANNFISAFSSEKQVRSFGGERRQIAVFDQQVRFPVYICFNIGS
jgi:hypothetical protein